MKIYTSYKIKIREYSHIFKETVSLYRHAVDFFINVCMEEWDSISSAGDSNRQVNYVESITHKTKSRPETKYDFDSCFYKFPSYLRRGAIMEAIGKVSSHKSNLRNWELSKNGNMPSYPKAGYVYPSMYRTVMYNQTDTYMAQLKVYVHNTWDWITVNLKKSDVDYINRRCSDRKQCAPTLQKRGKQWYLDFPFEESVKLADADIFKQTVLAVDLGINNSAAISVMRADGTVPGRHFLKLPGEYDSLAHSINRIKKAQQNGNYKTPRLWAKAKGINKDIAVKTARFIMEIAVLYNADVIVFEHLDLTKRKRGSKKQKLHMWRSRYVQSMVTDRAHRLGIRISRINAWGTSKLAYDGSGTVERGRYTVNEKEKYNYSICVFPNGKQYNCDLNATYNIGARYFIREILKSLPVTARLRTEAKVPQCSKRSTCTLSALVSLNAALLSA